MDIRRSVRHTATQLFYPPLNFVPAMYAGLLVFVGFTFIVRRDLFSFTRNYAVMEAWLPEWAWGTLAVLIGLTIAFSACGPPALAAAHGDVRLDALSGLYRAGSGGRAGRLGRVHDLCCVYGAG